MECIHIFDGAKVKGQPFHGWAGRVTEWLENSAPKVDFGKWTQDKSNRYGGGEVVFTCEPFDLVMFGANSKTMRSFDKSTQFGFAGLSVNSTIKIALLPSGIDARNIFAEGGWKTPDPQAVGDSLYKILDSKNLTLSELDEHVASIRLQVINGFGVNRFELDDVLTCWAILSPIQSALKLANDKKTELREQRAAMNLQHAKAKVVNTVAALRELGVEPTYLSITDYWLKGHQSNFEAKENVRKLKKILGEHLTDLSWALK